MGLLGKVSRPVAVLAEVQLMSENVLGLCGLTGSKDIAMAGSGYLGTSRLLLNGFWLLDLSSGHKF